MYQFKLLVVMGALVASIGVSSLTGVRHTLKKLLHQMDQFEKLKT